jgi:dephospho-CoA kinase
MNNKLEVFGITGTNGAGKGTVVEFLKQKGFKHYSASELILEEIVKLGLPQNRDSMIMVGNKLRSEFGAGYIAEELIKRAKNDGEKAIIESIRTVGEIDNLKKAGGILLAVDANQKIRFERAIKRGSVKDNITWEQFVEQENIESESTDPNKQNLIACRNLADYVINNDETLTDLENQVNNFIKKYE